MILVCYLLPPGEEFAEKGRRFAESWRRHLPGREHELLLILKGHDQAPDWVSGAWQTVVHENDGLDIGSLQRVAAERGDYEQVMWFGAHCRILADNWLAKFHNAAAFPGVGAVAATASFEAGVSGESPNAQIRTGALMIAPQLLNSLGFAPTHNKYDTFHFEHGPQSLYRRLRARGLDGVVVGRSGRVYREADWGSSGTYRQGDQGELLIADKHSDAFAAAGPDERLALARAAGWEP